MLSPEFGKTGIFSLSNRSDDRRSASGIANLKSFFCSEVVIGEYATSFRRFAGNDEERASVFNKLAADDSIGILIAMRGGYGVTRILEKIDFEQLRRSGKTVCGFSDVTALLLAAWKNGCENLYLGRMVAAGFDFPADSENFKFEVGGLMELLNGKQEILSDWCRYEIIRRGDAEGALVPVNLTLLSALTGTEFMPDLTGAILAIEDVGEPAHDIDRNLNHLRQCGILESLSGIIFGSFSDCEDGEYLPEIIREYAALVDGPALCNFSFGHVHPSLPMPFGKKCRLSVGEKNTELTLVNGR